MSPTTEKGVKQGCSLSPLLFCLFIDPLVRRIAQYRTPMQHFGVDFPAGIAWADDLSGVFARSDLTKVFHTVLTYCVDFGMSLNHNKTQLVAIGSSQLPPPLVITHGHNQFTYDYVPRNTPVLYLGVYIAGSVDRVFQEIHLELDRRLQAMRTLNLDPSTRSLVVNTSVIPFLTARACGHTATDTSLTFTPSCTTSCPREDR